MKKIMIVAVLALLVGCGGGSGGSSSDSAFDSVDNSALKTESNTYGYYGDKVKFGNHTVARRWTFTKKGASTFHLVFSKGDAGYHVERGDVHSLTFGVSQDARDVKLVLLSNNITVRLDSVIDSDCYGTTLTNTGSNETSSATVCAEK